MADKNCLPPLYSIKTDESGLSLRIEFDAHYLSNDEADAIHRYIEELRKLVRQLYEFAYREYPDSAELNFADRMRELGIEVDE